MKEFEKWFGKRINGDEEAYQWSKVGWKKALKWALEQDTWIGPDNGGGWGINKWDIEEELEK